MPLLDGYNDFRPARRAPASPPSWNATSIALVAASLVVGFLAASLTLWVLR